MTNEECIKILKSKLDGNTDTSYEWCECVRLAIKAIEQISHLKDRPCEACEFYTGEAWGCSEWECVFEGSESE